MDSEIPINSNSEKLPCDQSFEMKSQLDICNGSTKNSDDNEDTILQTGSGVTNVFKIKKTKSSRGPPGIPLSKGRRLFSGLNTSQTMINNRKTNQ